MASFGGTNIFGFGKPTIRTAINPRDGQVNAYPGVNNLERLDGGGRGRVTSVSGLLAATNSANLATVIDIAESFHDGNSYILVDNFGVAWPNVVLNRFEPAGSVMQDGFGNFFQAFTAEFLHLS